MPRIAISGSRFRLLTLILAVWLTFASSVGAQSISKEFDRATLIFKLSVSNPSTTPRHMTKVGVLSNARGEFQCLSAASGLLPLADYPIYFHVRTPQTFINADPILVIPPKESAAFTVSIFPNATGSCGYWDADVRVVALFDDGTRLESPSERIDYRDVEAARRRDPSRDEVLAGLQHRYPQLRYQALDRLSSLSLDTITQETLVAARIADSNQMVRENAYGVAAQLKLNRLEPALLERFSKIPKGNRSQGELQNYSSEALDLSRVLLQFKSLRALDRIFDVYVDPDFEYSGLIAEEINKFQTPETLAILKARLRKHVAWAQLESEDREPDNGGRYQNLLSDLIAYRDLSSVNLLKDIMSDPVNRPATRITLRYVLNLTDKMTLIQDPFVLAFHETALKYANDPSGDERNNLRESASILAVRTSKSTSQQQSILRTALKDSSIYVRLAAAEEVAVMKLRALLPEVEHAYQSSNDNLRKYFCEPLTTLGGTCR